MRVPLCCPSPVHAGFAGLKLPSGLNSQLIFNCDSRDLRTSYCQCVEAMTP